MRLSSGNSGQFWVRWSWKTMAMDEKNFLEFSTGPGRARTRELLAPGTVNARLAAARRLACEAAATGLLSPGVKGAKKLGMRLGNWLTVDEARSPWQLPSMHTVKGKRDRAILAVLLGCGLRRREPIDLSFDHIQRREDHWAIVDLVGKGGHIKLPVI
jgi:integrase